jgi:hypothetical protein
MDMIRTIFTPDSERITLPIPKKYVEAELEVIISPLKDASPADGLQKKPVFGYAKGQFKMADDFDAPLDDFIEYKGIEVPSVTINFIANVAATRSKNGAKKIAPECRRAPWREGVLNYGLHPGR